MPTHDGHDAGGPIDRLASIERLLGQYRTTKDRRLLRLAIELWDEVEAERKVLTATSRVQVH
jgi:hypothetical protein